MFPALLQLDIQMAQRGELAGEFRVLGSLDLASREKSRRRNRSEAEITAVPMGRYS
jgi:hypothetical protein